MFEVWSCWYSSWLFHAPYADCRVISFCFTTHRRFAGFLAIMRAYGFVWLGRALMSVVIVVNRGCWNMNLTVLAVDSFSVLRNEDSHKSTLMLRVVGLGVTVLAVLVVLRSFDWPSLDLAFNWFWVAFCWIWLEMAVKLTVIAQWVVTWGYVSVLAVESLTFTKFGTI